MVVILVRVQVHAVAVDVSDRAAVTASIKGLPDDFSKVRVLVNNAGLALGTAHLADGDVDDWENMIDVNCKGLLYVTKAVSPQHRENRCIFAGCLL